MAHTIVTDVCEGIADCLDACTCGLYSARKGTHQRRSTEFFWIDFDTCIDCGICLQVCPGGGSDPC